MKLSELAARLSLPVEGDGTVEIRRAAGLDDAVAGDLTFVKDMKYASRLATTKASAAIVGHNIEAGSATVLRSPEPGTSFVRAIELLHPRPRPAAGVHKTAVVSPNAKVGAGTSIGAFVFVDDGVEIGANCEVRAHAVLCRGAVVGDDCLLHSRVVLREGVRLGRRVIVQDGAVIGADGFGCEKQKNGSYLKIPHVGTVVVEDDVEIQANACVDRATLGETRVRRGTKIDNLVQVGHNCDVGEDTVLCGQVGLAGTSRVGRGCMLAGQVGVADHVSSGDGSMIMAQAGLPSNVPPKSVLAGSPATDARTYQRFGLAVAKILESLKTVRSLEERVGRLEGAPGGDDVTGTPSPSST